jgi:hypothetical protein
MTHRLIWNFEINSQTTLNLPRSSSIRHDKPRWEARFFWTDGPIITLHGLTHHFLRLSQYKIKDRQDLYYLLPHLNYNVKRRREHLFYKPISIQYPQAIAYDKKIKLEEHDTTEPLPGCGENNAQSLLLRIQAEGKAILVEKEALISSFPTSPPTTLELARLSIDNTIYFTASIESHALSLVENISTQLLGHLPPSDYVTFLKEISPL